MKYITYKNISNPHVTIHKDECSQIKKRGGVHKYGQGEYIAHDEYQEARIFAESTKLLIKDCPFCKPEEILPCQYWVELYWPSSTRDLSVFHVWFNEKKQHKNELIRNGDRILFYEVRRHPSKHLRGSKTVFASGTVLNETIYIPKEEQVRGGKRWLFKRLVRPDYAIPPEHGISLVEVKEILGMKGWPQAGFKIKNSQQFEQIESELKKRHEKYNQKASLVDQERTSFKNKSLTQFQSSGKEQDEGSRCAALEKAANAHKNLLNKLNQIICSHKHETSENQKVDLFTSINGATWIFEVKSTNDSNFLSQVRHGIAQLYEYRFLYFQKDKNVNLCLIVQTPPPKELNWIIEYIQTLEICLCWPVPTGFYSACGTQLEFLFEKEISILIE